MLAAVLAAIMSSVDSQLLGCANYLTCDLRLTGKTAHGMLWSARGTVITSGALATVAALRLPKNIFDSVLFAWAAFGSAFGPLLLVRLCRGPVAPRWALAFTVVGGALAIASFYAGRLVPTPGNGLADRVVSWFAAGVLVWIGWRAECPSRARG